MISFCREIFLFSCTAICDSRISFEKCSGGSEKLVLRVNDRLFVP